MTMSVAEYYSDEPSASQRFGADRGGGRRHRGADLSHSTKPGTVSIPFPLDGVVIGELSPASWHGFGYQVTVRSTYNGVQEDISIAHLSSASPVKVGDRVRAGQHAGYEGTTGATSGSCAHFERRRHGVYVDPMPLLRAVRNGTTPAPAGTVGRVTVKRAVRDIQRLVGAAQDGKYGPDTTAKVKAWQKRNGLAADGIWGPRSDAKGFPARPAPASTRPTVRRGSRGAAVELLQRTLKRNYSLYAGRLSTDGVFGPATQKAVREFQRRAGLTVDGIVGPKTWARLGL